MIANFNPRPPRGGRRPGGAVRNGRNISIHAPREGGDVLVSDTKQSTHHISIHAPREGGDGLNYQSNTIVGNISIHAPREGGDVPSL